VVTQEPAPTPSIQQQPSTAQPSPAPVPSPAGATTQAPPAPATGGVGQLESVAPEVIEDLPVPEDPESLVPEVIDEVPAPAVPGPQDVPSITSEVPTLPGQIVQDATPAVDVPTIPEPTGLIPNG